MTFLLLALKGALTPFGLLTEVPQLSSQRLASVSSQDVQIKQPRFEASGPSVYLAVSRYNLGGMVFTGAAPLMTPLGSGSSSGEDSDVRLLGG